MSSDAFASPFPGGAFQAILNIPIPDYIKLSGPLLAVMTHNYGANTVSEYC